MECFLNVKVIWGSRKTRIVAFISYSSKMERECENSLVFFKIFYR